MKRERIFTMLLVSGLLLAATACGDDDDPGSTDAPGTTAAGTEAPGTTAGPGTTAAPTTAPPSTAAPTTEAPDASAFCGAILDVEAAVDAEDPQQIEAAFAAAIEAAPDDIVDTVNTAVEEAETFMSEDLPPSDEFSAAYADVADYTIDACGWASVDVLAKDYEFGGIGGELAAGPTVIRLTNEGEEVHEFVVFRKNEGVTESFEELLQMPERKAMKFVTEAGAAFAFPGAPAADITVLEPGEHIALCFLPEGATPEAMEEAEQGGEFPEGQPHFMKGMMVEFTVS